MTFAQWKNFLNDLALKNESPAPATQSGGNTIAPSSGSTAAAQGSADAVGTDTFAQINTTRNTNDKGLATITQGAISATAAAQSTQESPAYASTSVAVSLPDADLIFYDQKENTSNGGNESATWAASSSTINFLAIDFKFIDFGSPKIVGKFSAGSAPEPSISGNLALFNTNVSASGSNSLTTVDQSALVVEDRFSSVSVWATAAVDDRSQSHGSFFDLFF